MRLKVVFGLNSIEKIVIWDKALEDFPKMLTCDGKKWEWLSYNSPDGSEYELIFTQIPTFDPNFYADMPSFESMFPAKVIGCECGSKFSSFDWDHFRYCGLWRPW